jgi:hypothetical protein
MEQMTVCLLQLHEQVADPSCLLLLLYLLLLWLAAAAAAAAMAS